MTYIIHSLYENIAVNYFVPQTERQPLEATRNINLTRITGHPAEIEVHLGATTGMPADSMDARGGSCYTPHSGDRSTSCLHAPTAEEDIHGEM